MLPVVESTLSLNRSTAGEIPGNFSFQHSHYPYLRYLGETQWTSTIIVGASRYLFGQRQLSDAGLAHAAHLSPCQCHPDHLGSAEAFYIMSYLERNESPTMRRNQGLKPQPKAIHPSLHCQIQMDGCFAASNVVLALKVSIIDSQNANSGRLALVEHGVQLFKHVIELRPLRPTAEICRYEVARETLRRAWYMRSTYQSILISLKQDLTW